VTSTQIHSKSFWSDFGLKISKHVVFMHIAGVISISLSAAYLFVRVVYTQEGANPFLFWLLFAAEFIGWLSLALFVRDSWQRRSKLKTGSVSGTTAILIPTYNEEFDVLLPTILGAKKVENCDEIWLLDDGRRPWVEQLARDKNIHYLTRSDNAHAKAGNINNALKHVSADFVLILDADHIPSPQIINKLLPYMFDTMVAAVQSPHGFRNLDSAQHYNREVHEQSLFFDVLLPGRNATNSVFWCGSGALLRMSALKAVGGVQTTTITEDLETSLAMQRAGFRTVYHDETLLQGLAPANLASYLIQRYRWARGTIEVLTSKISPIFGKGMETSTRISYLSNFVYYLVPFQHLAFVAVLVISLVTGLLPISASGFILLTLWLPQLVLNLFVVIGMSSGKQLPFSGSKNAWLTASIYVQAMFDRILRKKSSFQVTPKDGVEEGGIVNLKLMWLPATAAGLLILALLARFLNLAAGIDFLPAMTDLQMALATGFALYELAVIIPVVIKAFAHQQHRHTWRFPVDLQGRANGVLARISDLHLQGLLFEVHSDYVTDFEVGQNILIEVDTAPGKTATGNATIRRISPSEEPFKFKIGTSVEWADEYSRDFAVEAAFLQAKKAD